VSLTPALIRAEITLEQLIAPPVIPVLVIDELEVALPLARALARGGLTTLEVTLRTEAALAAISAIASELPEVVVGAGTLVASEQVAAASAAGAQFLVSPGATSRLLDALQGAGMAFLPGAATPSELTGLLERGITVAKLFPAQALGGIPLLRALHGPFPQMRFCATGGIDQRLAADYLALENVACVGGSWMVPAAALRARDWAAIEALARAAAALRR